MQDTLQGYLIAEGSDIHATEILNRAYIEEMINRVGQQKPSLKNNVRHTEMINFLKKYELRKQEFNEYFGELKN